MFTRVHKFCFLSCACFLVLTACSTYSANLEIGKQASKAGDFELAEQNLKPLADFGVNEARYEYALLLLKKENPSATQAELDLARSYLASVDDDNKPQALYELAKIYEQGIVVPKDMPAAKDYLKASGDLGYQRAYFELAQILEKEKDFVNAEGLYKHAFYNQYDRAALSLARMHEKGLGRPKDVVQALAWYMVAQRHNVSKAEEAIKRLSSSLETNAVARATEISTGLEEHEKN